jgi:hypothetical protein
VSLFFFSTALFSLSFLSNAATSPIIYVLMIFCNGFCTGAALNYTLAHLLHLASPENHFIATSLLATFRGFAASFGTAIGGGIFGRTLKEALTKGFQSLDGGEGLRKGRDELITKLMGSPALVFGGNLTGDETRVAVAGYETALRVLYQSATACCILVILVQAGTGWTAPVSKEEEENIREEIAEHDGAMEA